MNLRTLILTAPLAVVLACGGSTSTGTGSAALDAATPSFATLALDQTAADTTAARRPARRTRHGAGRRRWRAPAAAATRTSSCASARWWSG